MEGHGYSLDRNEFPKCPHCIESEYHYDDIRFDAHQGDVAIIECWACRIRRRSPKDGSMNDAPYTRLELRAQRVAQQLVGPEAPYSKIGRERRVKQGAAIAKYLVEFYKDGYIKGGNDTIEALRHG